MTVRELLEMFIEERWQRFELCDIENYNDTIFKGTIQECDDDLLDLEISSIDNLKKGSDCLTINVEYYGGRLEID